MNTKKEIYCISYVVTKLTTTVRYQIAKFPEGKTLCPEHFFLVVPTSSSSEIKDTDAVRK